MAYKQPIQGGRLENNNQNRVGWLGEVQMLSMAAALIEDKKKRSMFSLSSGQADEKNRCRKK